jgi:phosphatidylserine/phosphatidylglycerophosphate/cardiolipin synthase-like enzyme
MSDLSVLDQYAETAFAPGYPTDHRTFSAPTDNVPGAIQAVVESTTSTLVVAMYSFTHPSLVAAVCQVIAWGCPTLVVLDSSEFSGKSEQAAIAPLLAKIGQPNLRLSVGTAEDGSDIMHRKVAVIDGSVVVTGSFNWTESATREDNQTTIGIWPSDAALLTASIESTYAWQIAHCPQPKGPS